MEIGNVVCPLDTCIDVGFGLERLEVLTGYRKPKTEMDELMGVCRCIIYGGTTSSNTRQGYVLRKLLRRIDKLGGELKDPHFYKERSNRRGLIDRYHRLFPKNQDKSKEWWDTHGVDVDEV